MEQASFMYLQWSYFPRFSSPPSWMIDTIQAINSKQSQIESRLHDKLDSDEVLEHIRMPLENLGWEIEKGKTKAQKIERPVLHGDNGIPRVKYEIDGWHNSYKAVMEVESGRGWQGNAVYRDLIRASIMQEVDYLLLGVRQQYKYANVTQNDFEKTREQVEAIYASARLNLPFKGLLVFGW
jgi:hypothetical protein